MVGIVLPDNGLSDRLAVVTGAGRGIGRGIAERLSYAGASVAIIDIDHDLAVEAARSLCDRGYSSLPFNVDVSNRGDVMRVFQDIRERLGSPDILVNNAGIYRSKTLLDVDEPDWCDIINVNLSGAFWCAQAVAPDLISKGSGRIVNVASIGGKIGWVRNHAYCASKSGLIGLTRVLALELAPHGVTVNAICPGNTETTMMREVDADICRENGWSTGEFAERTARQIPLGRLASPQDIAGLAAFLCSPEAAFITGQAINVDGGLVMA